MPNFETTRKAWHAEQETARELRQGQSRRSNRIRRIDEQKSKLLRTDPQGRSKAAQRLDSQRSALAKELASDRANLVEGSLRSKAAMEAYLPLSDPRQRLGNMRDDIPILLLPLRLETRFKIIETDGAAQHQLWVRAYPDNCLINTFEEIPSEAEYLRARAFWIAIFRIGNPSEDAPEDLVAEVRNRRLGAWQALLEQSSSGRAFWLTREIRPLDDFAPLIRTAADDIFLVIPTGEVGPTEAHQTALRDYYTSLWRAGGDPALIEAAAATFRSAIGDEETAKSLLDRFAPAGLSEDDPRQAGPAQKVEVFFLGFPNDLNVDRTVSAWSEPARADMLPDRLVLQAFKNGKLVVDEIGTLIPRPLVIGPDPGEDIEAVLREAFPDRFTEGEEMPDDQKAAAYVEYLSTRSDTRWLYDFQRAKAAGMGFQVDLAPEVYAAGFDRLFVVGVRLSRDENESKTDLEKLLHDHQYGTAGLAILPQGLATNRTEDEESPYTQFESAEASFNRLIEATTEVIEDTGPSTRVDGRWLSDLLGIDAEQSGLYTAAHYHRTDQCESLAMQRALYPATLGSFLDSMLSPLIEEWDQEVTEAFFQDFVAPRGRIPVLRIDRQPYGILPVSRGENHGWLNPDFSNDDKFIIQGISDHAPTLEKLLELLNRISIDWSSLLATVPHLPRPTSDPHQSLLDVLGLHASSVEFDQRMAETTSQFINRMKAGGIFALLIGAIAAGGYLQRSKDLFRRHGIDLDDNPSEEEVQRAMPKIMELLFFSNHIPLTGPLIDDRPLSEINPIRAYTAGGDNYIDWLVNSLLNDPRRLRSQSGFLEGDHPRAMLFQLLRHATDIRAANTGLALYQRENLITRSEARLLRVGQDFVGVRQNIGNAVESRYELLYRPENRITNTEGNPLVIDHLAALLRAPDTGPSGWQEHLEALQHLARVPTARLERLMAEHLDCCNYRLDAWLQGFTNLQLYGMRYGSAIERGGEDWRDGIYLGAYGWVENLVPQTRNREPADLTDDQRDIFAPDGPLPEVDDSNVGHVHAPSLDHAATAAVLRNAYLSQSSREDPDYYSINLSSERVRMAMQIIEGMQAGQELGALLGYQLERGLHDRYTLALDQYIYALRTEFPLRENRQSDTELEEEELESKEQIAANNVVDGLWMLEKIREGNLSYPWGVTGLPASGSDEATAIIAEVARIVNINDAVADLALAESVHQVVKGNYDRAAGTLNAFSKGGIPALPEVVQTPRKGTQLNHRFALHLNPSVVATGGILNQAEVSIAHWVNHRLPSPERIGIQVALTPLNAATSERSVWLSDLGWTALDLLYQLDREGNLQLGTLDEPIQHFIRQSTSPPAIGTELKILYTKNVPENTDSSLENVSCFELVPLLHDLRQLLIATRPLRPTDLHLPAEAETGQDVNLVVDHSVYTNVRTSLENILSEINTNYVGVLSSSGVTLDDLAAMRFQYQSIKNNLDAWIDLSAGYSTRLQSYRPLNAHSDFAYTGRQSLYLFQRELITNWRNDLQTLLDQADTLLAEETVAAEDDKMAILKRVEPLLSTDFITSEDRMVMRAELDNKRTDFAAYLSDLEVFLDTDHGSLVTALDAAASLVEESRLAPLTTRRLDLQEVQDRVLILAQDLLRTGTEYLNKGQYIISAGNELLGASMALPSGVPSFKELHAAVRKLLGEDFQLLPRFSLPTQTYEEWTVAWNDRSQLLRHQQEQLQEPFPVDTWLHGLARVRPFVGHWERCALFSEDYLEATPLEIHALQFPYRPNDTWLGLEFQEDYVLDQERLLYTAHYAQPPTSGNTFCGLLMDEWTEVIPSRTEDTGLTFHFDRPNNEPPQSWLLALPEDFRGGWEWPDLVACLHRALDLAKLRAIEPKSFENTAYSHLLPTTLATHTRSPVIPQLNFAAVNGVAMNLINPDLDVPS